MEKTGDISVTFGHDECVEDAEDLGGPKREYFRLLLKAIVDNSGLLQGMVFAFT
jgi:type II secretory pathway predicted ATPase ExeA